MKTSWRMNGYASHTAPGMNHIVHGFYHGAYSLGFPAVFVIVSNSLFQHNTMTNILINAAYWLVTLGLMGSVLYSLATPEVAPMG